MRIGILGGTFDPIHMGHLLIAEEARLQLQLEEVLFIPVGQPWMKEGRALSAAEDRLNLVRLATGCNPFFRASAIEVERPGATYTVDTLRHLRQELGPDGELYFILGMDSLRWFHKWKDPAEVLSMCTLAVVARPGSEEYDEELLESVTPGGSGRVVVVRAPLSGISGTEIRARVARGESIRYHVSCRVERYIWTHGLYQGEGARDE